MKPNFSKTDDHHKILVTGAGGLIGNAVCHLLYDLKQPFLALYRIKPIPDPAWDFVYGDIAKDNLHDILAYHTITEMVHCAALIPNKETNFSECYKINSSIDKRVAEYLLAGTIRKFVYISTTDLYGISGEMITENSAANIGNPYSQGKLESEQLFFGMNSLSAISLRINAPYHFTQVTDTVLRIFINGILSGHDIFYHGTGSRCQDFTHVKDITAAVVGALKATTTGIYNISSGNPISMKDLASLILSKVPASKSRIRASGQPDPQEFHKALFNIQKAENELHWKPLIPLNEGLDQWIKYLHQ
jgi:nucleoside-diphosphate-sugar epimerase